MPHHASKIGNVVAVWTTTSTGNDVLYGVNAQTGHMLWNVSLNNNCNTYPHFAALPQMGFIAVVCAAPHIPENIAADSNHLCEPQYIFATN